MRCCRQPSTSTSNGPQAIGETLREAFDATVKHDLDRSEVFRRALRLGPREAAPEYVEDLRMAVRDHATRDLELIL